MLLTFPTPLITPPDTRTYFIMAVMRFGEGEGRKAKVATRLQNFCVSPTSALAGLCLLSGSVEARASENRHRIITATSFIVQSLIILLADRLQNTEG